MGIGHPNELSGVISANFGREEVWQFACHTNSDFFYGNNPDDVTSLSINYGTSIVSEFYRKAVTAGPAYVFGKDYNKSHQETESFATLWLIMNLQLILTSIKEIGIGIDVFTNINFEKTVSGVSLVLVLEGNK